MSIWCSASGPDILALDGGTEAANYRAEGDPVWVIDVATAGGFHDHIRLAAHDVEWERGVVVEALLSPQAASALRDRLDAVLKRGAGPVRSAGSEETTT
ncbi:hypothetical protein [Streptomyces ossamyceticus]|uniref:hypothetical protein n=1 Tax=Streptomyces ossamyceticus TaxID=249581 RepID=UPI0006E12FFC|nr:hypothetical protein [Streptomyces ossamyceticus]